MKLFKPLCLLLIVALVSACQNETIDEGNTPQTSGDISNDLALIKQLGMDESSAVDMGDYYLVEGDISLRKECLSEYLNIQNENDTALSLRQAYTGSLISSTNVKNITVGFDSSLPTTSDWRTITLQALEHWNNIPGSTIKFVYTTASSPNIKVYQNYSNDDRVANADFPASGKAGTYVKINSKYDYYDSSRKLFAIIHELGHCLGLRHTNWHNRPDGAKEDSAITIPGTPTADSESVMNANVGYWNGFSYYDLIGITYLYSDFNAVSTSKIVVAANTTITYTLNKGTATWQALANATLVSQQGNSATFKVTGNGYAKIRANINYSGRTYAIDNSKVWVGVPPTPTISPIVSRFLSGCSYEAYLGNTASGSTYTWTIRGGTLTGQSDSMVNFKINNFGYDGTATISVTATNACGSSSSSISVPVKGTGSSGGGGGIYPEI